jgi:hypothetical protein
MTRQRSLETDDGFSLIETVIATGILATGLLGVAAVFTLGLRHMASSSPSLIAREKAREAVESVHTARDTRVITWGQINNVAQNGVFVSGAQPLRRPGLDGLVNTADDESQIEDIVKPGPDGLLGTADDVRVPLTGYTRQIEITDLLDDQGNPNPILRQLRVTIQYPVGTTTRAYVLTTYVSSIS